MQAGDDWGTDTVNGSGDPDRSAGSSWPEPAPSRSTVTSAYPVTAEVVLPPVPRAGWRRRRRPADDLPPRAAGEVYVFQVDGTYVAAAAGRLDLADPVVVNAAEVCVVMLRPHLVTVDISVASAQADSTFTVRALFRCRVVDPVAVAGTGLKDLGIVLAGHLGADTSFGHGLDATSVHSLRRTADAQVRAYCMVAPPDLPGIELALANVEVLTAAELLARRAVADTLRDRTASGARSPLNGGRP